MIIAVISIILLTALAIIFAKYSKRSKDNNIIEPDDCTTCNGTNSKCEHSCRLEASIKPVEYFDDEELDTYAGRVSDSYTNEEIEQFAYILHTMKQNEIAGWCRSLTLRGISLPDELKDEVIMMINDADS